MRHGETLAARINRVRGAAVDAVLAKDAREHDHGRNNDLWAGRVGGGGGGGGGPMERGEARRGPDVAPNGERHPADHGVAEAPTTAAAGAAESLSRAQTAGQKAAATRRANAEARARGEAPAVKPRSPHADVHTPGMTAGQKAAASRRANAIARLHALAHEGKPGEKPPAPKPEPVADDLDHRSDSYRYKDTGYVAGSRKELAADMIRTAGRNGQRLRNTDIDWTELEQNPRQAAALITKSNLFGTVDWAAMRDAGTDPGAAFLMDRIYASLGKTPATETPEARKDYALGLETLRDRLEKAKTVDDVKAVLNDINDEIRGEMLNASEAVEYKAALAELEPIRARQREYRERSNAEYAKVQRADNALNTAKYEQSKRKNRGWKPDPELDRRVAELETEAKTAREAYTAFINAHPEHQARSINLGGGASTYRSEVDEAADAISNRARRIKQDAMRRNIMENPLTRAWSTLGPRFLGVVNYRSMKGSDAFAQHMANASAGRIKDWSWMEKEVQTGPRPTRENVRFQLQVADGHERTGGRKVDVDSTQSLKDTFGLREVQSGNWVLRDVNAAKFHTEQAAAALADLADMIGSSDKEVSLNGRLALAFGARGTGNAGGSAARAHYESVERVINITKMAGGGTLAHEWFHALDNVLAEMTHGRPGSSKDWATLDPAKLPEGRIKDAVANLRRAMSEGNERAEVPVSYTGVDVRVAKRNFERPYGPLSQAIAAAPDANAAAQVVRDYFDKRPPGRKTNKDRERWMQLAVAFHDGNPEGATVGVKAGAPMSSFRLEAVKLDDGKVGGYWSGHEEMGARAFQAWIEDKLASQARRNDYLSAKADNKHYFDPITGEHHKPFPEGAERTRINAAFDEFFAAIKAERALEKAITFLDGQDTLVKDAREHDHGRNTNLRAGSVGGGGGGGGERGAARRGPEAATGAASAVATAQTAGQKAAATRAANKAKAIAASHAAAQADVNRHAQGLTAAPRPGVREAVTPAAPAESRPATSPAATTAPVARAASAGRAAAKKKPKRDPRDNTFRATLHDMTPDAIYARNAHRVEEQVSAEKALVDRRVANGQFPADKADLHMIQFRSRVEGELRARSQKEADEAGREQARVRRGLDRIAETGKGSVGPTPNISTAGESTAARMGETLRRLGADPQGAWRENQRAADVLANRINGDGEHAQLREMVRNTPKHIAAIREQVKDLPPDQRDAILYQYGLMPKGFKPKPITEQGFDFGKRAAINVALWVRKIDAIIGPHLLGLREGDEAAL